MTADERQEAEADLFAMCLLLPEPLLRRDVQELGGIDLVTDEQAQRLAKRYDVSVALMTARLLQLAEDR